jgi:hypothetical protein
MANYDVGMGQGSVLSLQVNLAGQDVNGNFSVVNWALVLYQGNAGSSWSATPRSWNVQIHGSAYSGAFTFDFRSSDAKVIATGQTSIAHNADGTATIGVSASIGNTGTVVGGPASTGGPFTLPTIPRASYPTLNLHPITVGSPVTIFMNRASVNFYHTVEWYFGSMAGTIATGVLDQVSWTPDLSLLTMIPNSTYGIGEIRVHTYSGNTHIGSTVIAIQLNAPSSIVPNFSTITADEANATVLNTVGAMVQGLSYLGVNINGATGAYGSTIVSYRIEVAGQQINAPSAYTGVIQASGVVPVIGTVTDSRGRSFSKQINLNVLPYAPPSIDPNVFLLRRSTSTGTLTEQGTYIRVDLKAATQSLVVGGAQKNNITYKISTRLRGTTPWTLKKTIVPGGVAFNSFDVVGTYALEQAWEVQVVVQDKFNQAVIQGTVATAKIFMHWSPSGLGVGKFWEQGGMDVLGQIYQNDGKRVIDEVSIHERSSHYTGVIIGTTTSGLPYVRLDGGLGDVQAATVPLDVKLGLSDTVAMLRVGNAFHIVNTLALHTRFPELTTRRIFLGGFKDYDTDDGGWLSPRMTLSDGIVVLTGLAMCTVNLAAGTVIGTLPEGYRPDQTQYVAVNKSDTVGIVAIAANGQITIAYAITAGQYISFAGIAYPAAGVANWTVVGTENSGSPTRFLNGWTNFGGGTTQYGTAKVWKDPVTGMVWSTGLVSGGNTSAGAAMIQLAPEFGAKITNHLATESNDTMGYVYASANDQIQFGGGSAGNTHVSLSSLHWEPNGGSILPFTPLNMQGWAAYDPAGSSFTVPEYMRTGGGLVYTHGLINSVNPMGTVSHRMPMNHRQGNNGMGSTAAALYHRVSNTARGRLDTNSDGTVRPQQGSPAWFSLDGLIYATDH